MPSLLGIATGGGRNPDELPGLSLDLGGGAGLPLIDLGPPGTLSGVSGLGNCLRGVDGDLCPKGDEGIGDGDGEVPDSWAAIATGEIRV